MTLEEVITGLENGKRFKRRLDGMRGWELVRPVIGSYSTTLKSYRRFEHIVVGYDWSGTNEMDITDLRNGKWNKDGWELTAQDVKD